MLRVNILSTTAGKTFVLVIIIRPSYGRKKRVTFYETPCSKFNNSSIYLP